MITPSGRLFARRSWTCIHCRASSSSAGAQLRQSKNKLPDTPARTRFAPSPTGHLHLGSLRTALFNYLLAKRTGGQFLLRIEDTDQKRTITGAEQRLYDDLRWAGLHWDEGPVVGGPYGPYRQSERTALYQSHADDLISNGHAYRCFCSARRLDALARHRSQAGLPSGYDRKCADISNEESADRASKGETHVVRLKVEGYPMFNDLVYGKTGQNRPNSSKLDLIDRVYDDPILLKSDGHPTYHLANVVDDHCMEITHVIRGTEWMSSTPMHMALYNAFKWSPPLFGHVPLLVNKSRQKLSKRNADIDLSSFRDQQGIFPAALVNFAALLGWSHTQASDVFSLKELEQIFDLKITRGDTVVAFEKLWYLQKARAQQFAENGGPGFDEMVDRVRAVVENTHSREDLAPLLQGRTLSEYIIPLLHADAKSYITAQGWVERNSTYFTRELDRPGYSPSPTPHTEEPPVVPILALHTAAAALSLVPPAHWTVETHRHNFTSYDGSNSVILPPGIDPSSVKTDKVFKKQLYHYLRWALSAGNAGPGIPETMTILGREETLRRLQEAKSLTQFLLPQTGRRVPKSSGSKTKDADRSWMGSLARDQ